MPGIPAIYASTLDLDHRAGDVESGTLCAVPESFVDGILLDFRDAPALPANKELAGMTGIRMRTTNKGITVRDPVDQAVLHEKI
jgi:hypothetical protein